MCLCLLAQADAAPFTQVVVFKGEPGSYTQTNAGLEQHLVNSIVTCLLT